MTLNELFKNANYDDTLFSDEGKHTVDAAIILKSAKGSEVPYITCIQRNKDKCL